MAHIALTLTGTLYGPDGALLPPGIPVLVGAVCAVQAHTDALDALNAKLLAQGAPAVALAFPGGALPAFSTPAVWRRTGTVADGTFSLGMPSPSALAFSCGARTDADLDPARGGRWSVLYYAQIGTGPLRPLAVAEASADSNGLLDITTALAAPFGL